MPPRILALYSLACMEREGATYGYRVSQRIAERTEGTWRPGAGAVYPALRALVDRGLAVSTRRGRRHIYRITPRGRAVLLRVRRGHESSVPASDLSALWAEVIGEAELGPFLLRRLRRSTDALGLFLDRARPDHPGTKRFRREALQILDSARSRLRADQSRRGE